MAISVVLNFYAQTAGQVRTQNEGGFSFHETAYRHVISSRETLHLRMVAII